jgi:DNA-binding transcriptional MerR regulator
LRLTARPGRFDGEGAGGGGDRAVLVVVGGDGADEGHAAGDVVAGGPRADRLPRRRRAHVVDAQVDGRGARRRLRMAHHRRAAAGVHQRRDRAAVDHARLRVAHEARVVVHLDRRHAVADLHEPHAERAGMRDRLDELPRELGLAAAHPEGRHAAVIGPPRARPQGAIASQTRDCAGEGPALSSAAGRTDVDARLSFKEMCAKFDVTPRTLRYYEYIELLAPEKDGRARWYGPREVARMTLILRGRRFGFSLEEIRQWLEIYDKRGTDAQMRNGCGSPTVSSPLSRPNARASTRRFSTSGSSDAVAAPGRGRRNLTGRRAADLTHRGTRRHVTPDVTRRRAK